MTSAVETTRPAISRSAGWTLTGAATLTMAVSYFDRQTFAALGPIITEALSLTGRQYGLLGSAFSLAYLFGSPIAGRLVDRFGGRRVLLVAVLAWTLVAALHSLVWSFASLFFLRILLGFTESPSFPGATQTVHRALPPAERARGFGILFTGSSLGALVAPIAAGALSARYGFRVALMVTAIAGVVWVPMWLAATGAPERRAVLDKPAVHEVSPPMHAVLFHPAVLRTALLTLASAPVVSFVLLWGAKFLNHREGVVQADVGHYLWLPPLLFDLGAIAFGHAASKALRRRPEIPPLLFVVAGILASLMPIALLVPGPWVMMVAGGVAVGGVAGLFAMFTADMLSRVPASAVSTAGGVTAAAQSLAYVVVNPLIGEAFDRSHSYDGSLLVLSALVLPGVGIFLAWKPPPPRPH